MSIESKYTELNQYPKEMDLQPSASEKEINDFQTETGILLPEELKALYRLFNGGEIFVPGTTIFGFTRRGRVPSLQEINDSERRGTDSIPDQYLIIAKLNFGDYICIDTSGSGHLIQWDHEIDKEESEWADLEEWLADEIQLNESLMGEI